MLAIEFEGAREMEEPLPGPSDSSSDSEKKELSSSTPTRDEGRKKRFRGESTFGDLSGISDVKAGHELSSEDEASEDVTKKPRLTSEDHKTGSDVSDDDPDLDSVMVAVDDVRGAVGSVVEQAGEVPPGDPGPSHSGGDSPSRGK